MTTATMITAADVTSAAAVMPTATAFRAASAETSTVCVPAPIESGPVPAVEIEAIIPSAEDELRLLDGTEIGGHLA